MSENATLAIVTLIGSICTALISAVLGPVVLYFLKPANTSKQEGPISTQIRYIIPSPPQTSTLATASLICGLLGLCAWFIPLCGFPISMFGFLFGMASRNAANSGSATSGIVLSILGFILTCINFFYGLYLYSIGQYGFY
jgi:hypothetical protein